jgi:hypothetical protein
MSDVPTRLLREALRDRMATDPSPGCVDANTLAAWSDATLSARERAALETHLSNCARCQSLLGVMARTTPPVAARRWWRTSKLGWLVPLAAAAAALVLWMNVPAMPRLEQPAALPTPAAAASQTSVSAPAPPSFASSARRELPAASADRPAESKDAVTRQRQARVDENRLAAAEGAAAAAPQPAPAPSVSVTPPQIATRELAPGTTRDTSSAAAPTPPAAARAEARAKMVVAPTQIVSPNPNIRWRPLTGGNVERSIDGGTTWQTQATGALTTLTAGVAPSATICWLVGPGGSVVLSIDGRTWQRVPIPEAIDLTSISASDAAAATVTAADGRTFTTLDGGRTWRSQ